MMAPAADSCKRRLARLSMLDCPMLDYCHRPKTATVLAQTTCPTNLAGHIRCSTRRLLKQPRCRTSPPPPPLKCRSDAGAIMAPLGIRPRVYELGGAIGSNARCRTTGELDARLTQCSRCT